MNKEKSGRKNSSKNMGRFMKNFSGVIRKPYYSMSFSW